MKLFFVNVECEVRKESRISAEAKNNPYRVFTYAVVAASEREAVSTPDSMSSENWYELRRWAQNPDGYLPGEAVFQGSTDMPARIAA